MTTQYFEGFPNDDWTCDDQQAAEREGWAIFGAHGALEIDKDDDSDRFQSGDDALEHVCREAAKGSRLHARALAVHTRHAIDIFKAAHGYGPDDQIPQTRTENEGC